MTKDTKPETKLDANAIGWSFVRSYYELFSKQTDILHKMYSPDAKVAHDDLDSYLDAKDPNSCNLINVQAKGIEEIKSKIFGSKQANTFKFVLTNVDVQEVNELETILIFVMGEVAKNDSVALSFVQTFIISKSSKVNYVLTNDILRLVPLFEEERNDEVAEKEELNSVEQAQKSAKEVESQEGSEAEVSTAATSTISTPSKKEAEIKSDKPEIAEKVETAESTAPPSAASAEKIEEVEKVEKIEKVEKVEKAKKVEKVEKVESEKAKPAGPVDKKEKLKTNEKSKPEPAEHAKPTSWAAKAAKKGVIELPKSAGNSSSSLSTAPSSASSSSKPVSNGASTAANTTKNTSTDKDGFGIVKNIKKAKKATKFDDDFFPIYIRGIHGKLTNEELTAKLEENFGEVVKCQIKDRIALVEFKNANGQSNALAAKSLLVKDDMELSLEPRKDKNRSGSGKFANGNKKPFIKKPQNGTKVAK